MNFEEYFSHPNHKNPAPRESLLTLLISSLVAQQPRGLCGGLGRIELRRVR